MCQLSDHEMIFTVRGEVRRVDACMRSLVQHLNDIGIGTFDCCCGHGRRHGHITISQADAERARSLGFRVCSDIGSSRPAYPFTGILDARVNIILPPVILEEAAA